MIEQSTPSDWGAEYARRLPEYEALRSKYHALIEDVLDRNGIEIINIESRVKSAESFSQKVSRKGYSAPLSEITDLVGLRIITYYVEDVARVCGLLEEELAVHASESEDKTELLRPDQFGYKSVHYVVSLDSARSGLPEWGSFKDHRIEVQVRTAAQHAWAAIEHKLAYKSTEAVPAELERRLSRLSALFELADEQFSLLRDAREAVDARYSERLRGGDLDIDIDASSLGAYIDASDRAKDIARAADDAGFEVVETGSDEAPTDSRGALVKALSATGVQTIAEFDKLLADASGDALDILERLRGGLDDRDIDLTTDLDDSLAMLVLFLRDADETQIKTVYSNDVVADVYKTARTGSE